MDPVLAKELYERFVVKVGEAYDAEKVKDGVFQAMMEVALVNDGPVSELDRGMLSGADITR